MRLEKELTRLKDRSNHSDGGFVIDDKSRYEEMEAKRRRERLENNIETVEERLLPVLEAVNEVLLGGMGKVEGPLMEKRSEDYSNSYVGVSLRRVPRAVKGGNGVEGDRFELSLRIGNYEKVGVIGKSEDIVWALVDLKAEDWEEKLNEGVIRVIEEGGAGSYGNGR